MSDKSSSPRLPSRNERRQAPRFDMNLKDLFSDDDLVRRTYPKPGFQRNTFAPDVPSQTSAMDSAAFAQQPVYSQPSPQNNSTVVATTPSPHKQTPSYQNQYNPTLTSPPQQQPSYSTTQLPFTPFTDTYPTQPDFAFDTTGFGLDFLDTYQTASSGGNNPEDAAAWASYPGFELDLGFGTGGSAAGWDGMAAGGGAEDWADGGGMDLFDGFFFGNGNGNAGGGGGEGY